MRIDLNKTRRSSDRTSHEAAAGQADGGFSRDVEAWVAAPPGNRGSRWREMVAHGLYHTGALRLTQKVSRSFELQSQSKSAWLGWRRVANPKLAILCYHGIGEARLPVYPALPREAFEAQIRFLRERYRIVSLEEACRELQEPKTNDQSIAVTFDDGYRSAYTHAFPVLEKYKVPATIFVTVDAIETGQALWYDRVFLAVKVAPEGRLDLVLDRPRRFCLNSPISRLRAALEIVTWMRILPDRLRRECCAVLERHVALPQDEMADCMLTWKQIRTMHQAGIAFGSHTLTHPVLGQLLPDELHKELFESKRILEERLGSAVQDFAFPFGKPADCGTAAQAVLTSCGYQSAVTTVGGLNIPGANLYQLRRVQVEEDSSLEMFAFQLSRLFLRAGEEDENTRAGSPTLPLAAENSPRELSRLRNGT